MSIWAACVLRMSSGVSPIIHFVCAGIDPNKPGADAYYQDRRSKTPITGIIIVASVIFHVVVNLRIFFFNREEKQNNESISLGTLKNPNEDTSNRPQQAAQ